MVSYDFLSELTNLSLPPTSKMTLLTIASFPDEKPERWSKRIGIPYSALTEQVIPSLEQLGYLARTSPTTFSITLENSRKTKKRITQKKEWIFEIEYICKCFRERWEKHHKTSIIFTARDRYKIQDTLKKIGIEEMERRITLFFSDDYSKNLGYPIGFFLATHSKLVEKHHETTPICQRDNFDSEIQDFESRIKRDAVSFRDGGIWS